MQTAHHIHDDTRNAFAVLWAWLRRAATRSSTDAAQHDAQLSAFTSSADVATQDAGEESAVVLKFPLRGEALLVRLAELLRRRVAELVPQCERLQLTLSHNPLLCLTIDDSAYIEFNGANSEFNLVIEAPTGTRMIIQTTDFDAIVKFVLQYVVEKLSDDPALEAAS